MSGPAYPTRSWDRQPRAWSRASDGRHFGEFCGDHCQVSIGCRGVGHTRVGGLARSETLGWVKCGTRTLGHRSNFNLLLPVVREGLTGCSVRRPLRRASPVDVLGSRRSALQWSCGAQRRCPEDVGSGKSKFALQMSKSRGILEMSRA